MFWGALCPHLYFLKEALMLYTIPVINSANVKQYIFLFDTETKSGFKEVKNDVRLFTSICNRYHVTVKLTKDIYQVASQKPKTAIMPIMELTNDTEECYESNEFLTMQDKPALMRNITYKQMQEELEQIPKEQREADEMVYYAVLFPYLQASLDDILNLSTSSKIDLTEEFFSSKELSDSMCSKRPIFDIPMTENQNAIQESNEGELSIALPSLTMLREMPEEAINIYTLINIVAPYRRLQGNTSYYSYCSEYHTPYFRTQGNGLKVNDTAAKARLASDFKWVYGNSNNNLLPLQPNEQKLYNNLKTLYSADITENLYDILTGIINNTTFGINFKRLVGLTKEKALEAITMLPNTLPDFIEFSLPNNVFEEIPDEEVITKEDISSLSSKVLTLNAEQMKLLITENYIPFRTISCEYNIVQPHFEIDNEKELIYLLLEKGYITSHFKAFITSLISMAYSINWGHTGTAHAISCLYDYGACKEFDDKMSDFLNKVLKKASAKKNSKENYNYFSSLNGEDSYNDENDDFNEEEELSCDYPWYITSSTKTKIKESINGFVDDYSGVSINALDTESKIIERWRVVDGHAMLNTYLSNCFDITNNIDVYLLAFLKLLRWGDSRKPTFLVFPEFPEIKTVLDLNESEIVENIFIVEESDVVKHNGCDYTLTSVLRARSKVLNTRQPAIVGFLLTKDYGKIQKHYIVSWSDLQEEYAKDAENVNIYPLTIPHQEIHQLFQTVSYIEDVPNEMEFDFYVSDKHIKQSHEFLCEANELSECKNLIIPDVMRTNVYRTIVREETIQTNKDRQYHILKDYISKLGKVYQSYQNDIEQITTVQDLIRLLNVWGSFSEEPSKKEHNDAVGAKTLQRMQLGSKESNEEKLLEQLQANGKYIFVVDKDCAINLPPLTFEDPYLNQLALKCYNRVVLTILIGTTEQGDTAMITDTSAITKAQLKCNANGRPSLFLYDSLVPLLKAIKEKGTCKTKSGTFYLHPSLKGKLL